MRVGCVVLAVVAAACVSGTAAAAERRADPFVERVLAALPQPAPGQFQTPESVVEAFVAALNANDLDAALRCFPIREQVRAESIDASFEYTGVWIAGESPLPAGVDDFRALHLNLDRFSRIWTRLRNVSFAVSPPAVEALLGGFRLLDDQPGARTKLDALKAKKVTARYELSVGPGRPMPLNTLDQALGVTEKIMLELSGTLGVEPLPAKQPYAVAVKLGPAWRLTAFDIR